MKIHLYTLCWNEADVLEFFFRHYDPWVDKYVVFDDGSTDGSTEILKAHPKVELRQWNRSYPESYLISQTEWLNSAWKESRGVADWVAIVDIDEHLFIPNINMKEYLADSKAKGVTLIPALGYQMITKSFPDSNETLAQSRTRGIPLSEMCKLSLINPEAIDESNFTGGRHTASPTGNIKLPGQDDLLLLHYKYLGTNRTLEKIGGQYDNMQTFDTNTGLLLHYGWSREKLNHHLKSVYQESKTMAWESYDAKNYPYFYRWWRLEILYLIFRWGRRAKRFVLEPNYMIKRLKLIFTSKKYFLPSEKFSLFMEKINRSAKKKTIYQLAIANEFNGNNTAVSSGNKDERGSVIQCLPSNVDGAKIICGIQKAIDTKIENEGKLLREFDAFVVSSIVSFPKTAEDFARKNDVKLISREGLIEFISKVNIE